MTRCDAKILIVGGGSRIATALAQVLGNRARLLARNPSGFANELLIAGYDRVPPALFCEFDCVVNCVGTSSGSNAMLERVNVRIAADLAAAARNAGVRRFIHVSSFSVYGSAQTITSSTPARPEGAYGRSKLAGDRAIIALTTEDFSPVLLRLPLIYAPNSLGKLGQLLRLWTRLHVLPVPTTDVARSMISADLSAEIIARLCTDTCRGVVLAADSRPFTYAEAAATRPELLIRIPLPGIVARFVTGVAPELGRRLFNNSQLSAQDNLAIGYGLGTRLYDDIAAAKLR